MKRPARLFAIVLVVLMAGGAVALGTLFDGRWGWPAVIAALLLGLMSLALAVWTHHAQLRFSLLRMNAAFALRIIKCDGPLRPVRVPTELVLVPPAKITLNASIVVGVPPVMSTERAAQELARYLIANHVLIISLGPQTITVTAENLQALLGPLIARGRLGRGLKK